MAATILGAYLYFLSSSRSPFDEFAGMRVGEGEVGIMFLGTSAFIIRTSRHAIIIDPAAKMSKDDASSLGTVDAILITHEHGDHFDASSTFDLHRANEAVVVVNEGAYASLEGLIRGEGKLVLLEPGEAAETGGVVVKAIASNHSGLSPLMYFISMDGVAILHCSDSGFVPELADYAGEVDVAILPAGGASPTASPSQAFKMAEAVMPKIAIPMHGTSAEYGELRSALESLQGVQFLELEPLSPQVVPVPP
ncbi:MAG: MBL fold metallo-hydrolase [Candidatus Brockarchaeota archaeon]|nr:MBL fold metallo-hydrolase [Candidatus Brockarchaeota archaeon]